MKKVSKQLTTSPSPNLQELLDKYDAQKELLLKENKELQYRIHQQISQNHKLQEANNSLIQQVNKLKHQLASKEKQILILQSQNSNLLTNNNGYSQEQYEGALLGMNQYLKRIKEDQVKIEELEYQLQTSQKNYDKLEKIYKNLKDESVEGMEQIKALQDQINTIRKQASELKQILEDNLEKMRNLTEMNQKLESKNKDRKKKYKQLQGIVGQQEIQIKQKMTEYELQRDRLKNQLFKSKQQFQKVWKQLTQKNTTIDFQNLQIAKLQKSLNQSKQEDQLQIQERQQRHAELQIKCSSLTTQNIKLKDDIERVLDQMINVRNQMKDLTYSYDIAYKAIKQKMIKQILQKRTDILPEELLMRIDRLVDQVRINSNKQSGLNLLKQKQKLLQNQIKYLKQNSKSKNNRSHSVKNNQQIIRLQNQIAFKQAQLKLFQNQAKQSKQQNQFNLSKIIDYKKRIDELEKRLEKQQNQIKKKQEVYTIEMTKCLNQLYQYKDKLGNIKQIQKSQAQHKQMMATKVTGYQKKIKQLLQSLDRKQEIIRGLKQSKKQSEVLLESLYDRLNKVGQVDDVVKKLKQDLSRKDQLMNSYKTKHDILKHEFESLKDAYEKLQKQTINLDKQLQRKTTYVNTMKDKYQKQMAQIQKKLKSNSDHTKSVSNVMQHKLISIKKQCLNYEQLIEDMKKYILDVIEQLKQKELQGDGRRNKSKKKRKQNKSNNVNIQTFKNAKDWQATKVLGLNQSELEQFINPKPQKVNRKKYQQKQNELERVWLKGDMLQYFQYAISYIVQIINT